MGRILRIEIDGCHNCLLKRKQKISFFKSSFVCINPLNKEETNFFVDLNITAQTFHENCKLNEKGGII